MLNSMLQESDARAKEAELLKYQLFQAKIHEREARDNLANVLRTSPSAVSAAATAGLSLIPGDFQPIYHQHQPLMITTSSDYHHPNGQHNHHQQQLLNQHHLQQHYQQPRVVPSTSPALNSNNGTNIFIGNPSSHQHNHNLTNGNIYSNPESHHQVVSSSNGMIRRSVLPVSVVSSSPSANHVQSAAASDSYLRMNQSPTQMNGQLMAPLSSSPPTYSNLYSNLQFIQQQQQMQHHQQQHQRVNSVQNETNILNQLRASMAASHTQQQNNSGSNNNLQQKSALQSSSPPGPNSPSSMNVQYQRHQVSGQPTNGAIVTVKAPSESVSTSTAVVSNSPLLVMNSGSQILQNSNPAYFYEPSSPSSGLGSSDLLVPNDYDVEKLAQEVEKERNEYLEKSKLIQNQLRGLRVDEKSTALDKIYEEKENRGETKYSTLRRTKSGSTKARVSFFEEL